MRIQKIESQHRRDFYAILECEHCGETYRIPGYDDDHFHRNVIPEIPCRACGKTADRETFRPLGTKYAADEIV